MPKPSLFGISWILLLLLAGAVTLFAIGSAVNATGSNPDALTPAFGTDQLATIDPEAVTAVRGRRLTASAWALAFGILAALVVLVPYRRGERWAWWALLISLGASQVLSLLRVVTLNTQQGAAASGVLLAILLVALLAGAPRIFGHRSPDGV
jgi:hypothetical protein